MTNSSSNEHQIQQVENYKDLVSTPFYGEVNAICMKRELKGDFEEIVNSIALKDNITEIDTAELLDLKLSEQGQLARETLLNDLKVLKENGASPSLNLIKYYERDDAYPLFPTDVYSYHVDRSPVPTNTYLCTYYGEPSDILPNAQGIQKVLVPEIRTELKKLHGKSDDSFEDFLTEYFFDLHYQAKPDAQAISLGVGNLWRLAVDHPESKIPPCLHRAPIEKDGKTRLLMIC